MIVSDRGKYSLYLILLTVHIALVWLLPYFPSQDGPNHLHNLYILKDLLHGGHDWGHYYRSNLNPSPNLGFTLVAYPLAYFFPPLITEKLFLSLYIILLSVAIPVLMRTFDRPVFPLSFLVFPVMFNHSLLMGFYSYAISVPLFILCFSIGWKIRNHPPFVRFICLNLTAFTLFYFHLISFGFFLISLGAIAFSKSHNSKQIMCNLMRLGITISPALLNLLLYLTRKTEKQLPEYGQLDFFQNTYYLIRELFTFSTVNLSPWQLLPAFLFVWLIIVMMYESLKDIWRNRRNNIGLSESEKAIVFLVTILTLICLFAPFSFSGGSYFNERFPWVILLLSLPILRMPGVTIFRQTGSALLIFSVAMFFIVTSICLWEENLKVAAFVRGIQGNITPGSFVVAYKTKYHRWPRIDDLQHASAYYGMFTKCVDIGNYEVHLDYFQVRLNNGFPKMPSTGQMELKPATIRWPDYPSIDFLLAWDIDNGEQEELVRWFHCVFRNGLLTIWQRH